MSLRSLARVAAVVEAAVIIWLCVSEDIGWTAWMVAIVLLGALLLFVIGKTGVSGTFALLAISGAMSRIMWTIGGLHARLEYFAAGFVALVVTVHRLGNGGKKLQRVQADYLLLAYVIVSLVASTFASPDPSKTLRWAALGTIAILPYFLLRPLLTESEDLVRCWRLLIAIGIAESSFGLLCFTLNRLFGTQIGVEVEQYGEIPGTFGTQFEANLFGAYAAACAVMSAAAYIFDGKERRRLYATGFVIGTAATVISLSRAAIVSLPIVLLVLIWFAARRGKISSNKIAKGACVVCILAAVLSPVAYPLLEARFSTLDAKDLLSDETTRSRVIQYAAAIEGTRSHPWLGTGTSSLQLFFDLSDVYGPQSADVLGRGAWVGNTIIRVLHDTGIVGILVLFGFILALASPILKRLRRWDGSQLAMLTSLAFGLLVYALTFQATDGTMLCFVWVHLGLCGCILATSANSREYLGSEIRNHAP